MKFANYIFSARTLNNLGDNIQIIAIDELYKAMGVKDSDIIYIDLQNLRDYSGEYVVLPVTMPLVDYREDGIAGRFSDKIIPVFLGLTLVKETLQQAEIEYLKKHEPIGCRDERTLKTIRKYNIESYLHGCITITLPKRKENTEKQNTVFIVDAPKYIENSLPEHIKNNVEYKTHLHEGLMKDPKKMMQEYYDDYKNRASLIITSLLHCSMPCMAAGIPVLLVKDKISYRFGWVEKLIKIHSTNELKSLDWSNVFNPIEYENHKKDVLNLTIKRLTEAFNKYNDIFSLSCFYENREKSEYIIDACESLLIFIKNSWIDKDAKYTYSIWGLTQIAEYLYSYIGTNYPNATLCHVYDAYRKENFYGLVSETPDNIENYADEIVFIAAHGAENPAKELFKRINKKPNTYAFVELIK